MLLSISQYRSISRQVQWPSSDLPAPELIRDRHDRQKSSAFLDYQTVWKMGVRKCFGGGLSRKTATQSPGRTNLRFYKLRHGRQFRPENDRSCLSHFHDSTFMPSLARPPMMRLARSWNLTYRLISTRPRCAKSGLRAIKVRTFARPSSIFPR